MTDVYWRGRGTRAASLDGFGRDGQQGDGISDKPMRRVGLWFEHVHLAALRNTAGVEILAANSAMHADGRTMGELDVLYRKDGRVVHRELAVKYYLAARPGRAPECWVGPGRRDRLDLKLDRLATHQLTLARRAREQGIWPEELPFPDETEVLMAGALFSPVDDVRLPHGANSAGEHGRWYYASDFAERFGNAPWCTLDKPWWLSPDHAREQPTVPANMLASELHRPRFVARMSAEVERAFVVPNGWWDALET